MSGDGAEPLILIVDDYADAREMYVEYLGASGFRTAEASDGQQAVDVAKKMKPAVILMDLSLPIIDGVEATRRIKADPELKHVHIIALTGHSEKEHTQLAKDAGAASYILKPCMPDDLVNEINRLLKRS